MMHSAKRGRSAEDLERLYDEHATAMFRQGMALLRDVAGVNDLLQDVFLKLAEGRGDVETASSERAYVLRMVHHAGLDRLRRMKVRQEHAAQAAVEMLQPCPDPDREAFRKQLEKALAQLPVEQRAVVVLKLWEERTFQEISAICDIPLNTAASRYRYALDKLRSLLRPVYEDL